MAAMIRATEAVFTGRWWEFDGEPTYAPTPGDEQWNAETSPANVDWFENWDEVIFGADPGSAGIDWFENWDEVIFDRDMDSCQSGAFIGGIEQ